MSPSPQRDTHLLPFLPAFVTQIRDRVIELDEITGDLSQSLGDMSQMGQTMAHTFRKAVIDNEKQGVQQNTARCRTLVESQQGHAKSLVRDTREFLDQVFAAMQDFAKALEALQSMAELARDARVLSLNGKIQARHMGERGATFNVIAHGLEELAVEAARCSSSAITAFDQHKNSIDSLTDRLLSSAAQHEESQQRAARDIDGLLTDMVHTAEHVESAVLSGTSTSEELDQRLRAAVDKGQRLDRCHQAMSEACNGLDALLVNLAGNPAEDSPDAATSLTAHLERVEELLTEAPDSGELELF